jgi:hypothetical protein
MSLKLSQLKTQAFRLSGVQSTKALKKLHGSIAALDMRLKKSWIRVIEILENLSYGVPVWDESPDTLDSTINRLLDFQGGLVEDMGEIGLNLTALNQEFIL